MTDFIKQLEAERIGDTLNRDAFFKSNNWREFTGWLGQYLNTSVLTDEAMFELAYYLYLHENMDLYPVDVFQAHLQHLSETYGVLHCDFLEFFHEFKKYLREAISHY